MQKPNIKIGEVNFANHLHEFARFYDKHKSLCDEITGMQKRVWYENGEEKTMKITKTNFLYAIKKLSSFVIDNIHYIVDKEMRKDILKQVNELEQKYIEDEIYQEYIKKEKILTTKEKINFNVLYFNYIIKCFTLSSKLVDLLQNSIMISTSEIKKTVDFYDLKQLYENLAKYRDEVSNDISNFSFKYIFKHFKKILGYYYTYKIMIPPQKIIEINMLIQKLFSYIMNEEIINYVILANNNTLNQNDLKKIKQEGKFVKNVLMQIYKMVNESLSEKRILPKVEKDVLIDKTLI